MNKRYLLFPGHVASKAGGQVHYIDAQQLMECYNLLPSQCIVWADQPGASLSAEPYKNMIWLRPRYHGDYATYLPRAIRAWESQQLRLQTFANYGEPNERSN